MARWITVRQPFDYHWPGRHAITVFREADCGDQFVKDEIADFAVENGYATEGKLDGSSRSKKSTGKRIPTAKKEPRAGAATNARPATIMGDANADHADRPSDGPAVDRDAG